MTSAISATHLEFPLPFSRYQGKVRDVYNLKDTLLVLVATDRISAFDVVLPRSIPYKGQVLNQLAAWFLQATDDIVPNYLLDVPDPNVSVGLYCKSIPVEFVVRGYLCGHAWREYKSGNRIICGASLPEGLREYDELSEPILTPTTKSVIGHDEDISPDEIIRSGLLDPETLAICTQYAFRLFQRGQEMAALKGLILADSKYEFGLFEEEIHLIDEIHTPDSSRYYMEEGFQNLRETGQSPTQLSKEFVREWLIQNNFMGKEGQTIPYMTDDFVLMISQRYIELYEYLTGTSFVKASYDQVQERIQSSALQSLKKLEVLR